MSGVVWRQAPPRVASGGGARVRRLMGVVAPPVVLVVVAVVLAWLGRPWWVVGLPVVGVVVWLVGGGRLAGWVDRFAAVVGRGVTVVLFGVLAVPLVVVPFVLGVVWGVDAVGSVGRWARPPLRRGSAVASWANDRPVKVGVVPRVGARVVVSVVVLAGVVWVPSWSAGEEPNRGFTLTDPASEAVEVPAEPVVELRNPAPAGLRESPVAPGQTPGALLGDEWWSSPDFQSAEGYLLDQRVGWRHENPVRKLDLRSRYINVVDGRRSTWAPPPCDCRRLTVWMYGGSTTWGLGQRDEHTIASELARVAFEHGIVLDVHNRGLTGFNHWMEAERFAWDLTAEPAPDLAVFYDGVNEIYGGQGGNEIREGLEAPTNPALFGLWRGRTRTLGPAPTGPQGARITEVPERVVGPAARARKIVRRFDRSREMSADTAEHHGVPVRYFWQPSRYDRPLIEGEPHWNTSQENDMRLVMQVAADHLAPDVFDLSRSMEHNSEPVFTDDVHHNEAGSRLVAEAMFAVLVDELRNLASS